MSQNSSGMVETEPSPSASAEQVADRVDIVDEQLNVPNEVEEPVFELFDSDDEDYRRRCELIEAIVNAPTLDAKRKAQAEGCTNFHRDKTISKRQLSRYVNRYLRKEFHLLVPGRKDKGQFRKGQQWYDFIIKLYEWGQRDGSRMNIHQVYTHLNALSLQGEKLYESRFNKKFKGFPQVREDLVKGEYPTDPTIRKYINYHLSRKSPKARHPGAPFFGQVLQTVDGVIELTHSGQAWQCDHTKLDVLVVDDNQEFIYEVDKNGKEILGRPYITIIQDAFSGCIMGFHLGLEQAGSHEVALALRHAILPKSYDPRFSEDLDFDVNQYWKLHGTPEHFVTDRAREFKSLHIKHVARQLDFTLSYRSFPQAGGLVENVFDKFNKELLSLLPGYTGSNVKTRPDNAEKFVCITLNELEVAIVRYLALHWNNHNYPKSEQQIDEPRRIRYDRWNAHLLLEPSIREERELDVCLLKEGKAHKVEQLGFINAWRMKYQGDCLKQYIGQKICFRYDERNVMHLMAYTLGTGNTSEKFIGILSIRDLDRLQISLEELRWMQGKLDQQGKKTNEHAILAIAQERLSMHDFVEKKRSEMRRAKRKKAQAKRDQETNQSKLTELFPDKNKKQDIPLQQKSKETSNKTQSEAKPKKPVKRGSQRRFDKSIMDWDDVNSRVW